MTGAGAPAAGPAPKPKGPVRRPAPSPTGGTGGKLPLQAKLTVGHANDALEAEADGVADRVMRMAEPAGEAGGVVSVPGGVLQRECAACEEEAARVHRKGEGAAANGMTAPPIVHDVLRSPGQPLDAGTRAYMEPRFGHDFSGVRVHTGVAADASARAVDALAYTVGSSVVLRQEAPSASSVEGQRLVAHELAHVVQQSAAPKAINAGLDVGPVAAGSSLQRQTPNGGAGPVAVVNWPDWAGTRLTTEQQSTLGAILAARERQPVRPDLKLSGHEGGPTVPGYAYGAKDKGGTLAANAPRYLRIAMKEYWPTEGGVAAINTWDTPVRQAHGNFTLGPGMLNAAAASLMRKWFDADRTVAEQCRDQLGVWVTPSLEWRVISDSDDILTGDGALSVLNDAKILSGIMNLAEGGHGAALDKAEQDWVTANELPKIPAEAASWDDAAIAVCLHIQHGAPAYSWSMNHDAYVATGGDPFEISRAFAVITARKNVFHRLGNPATGPTLVTQMWGNLVYNIFGVWGVGGGKPGYLQQAIDAGGIRVAGSLADLGANQDLQGHVLYKIGESGDTITVMDIGAPTPSH